MSISSRKPFAARKKAISSPSLLFGSATRQALVNFPISGWKLPDEFLRALALLKEHAAIANGELGEVGMAEAQAIACAARAIKESGHADRFPVDVFQTGSGTSTNMNMNEVIATLANGFLRASASPRGGASREVADFEPRREAIHPNDHVNRCQSSNDIIPSALQIACVLTMRDVLMPPLAKLREAFLMKGEAWCDHLKLGRTHLMDAVPVRFGDEIASYATLLGGSLQELQETSKVLAALPLGGTAVGTGVNAHPEFAAKVIACIARETSYPFRKVEDPLAAQSCPLVLLRLSAALRAAALAMGKAAQDIRLMASGPVGGFHEISLAPLQAGSSIMPGKVNPVLCESVLQVVSRVVGADATVTHALSTASNFELCTAYPLLAHELLTAIRLLANVSHLFARKCVLCMEVNTAMLAERMARSPMLATALAPRIGYDAASEIAEEAVATGSTVLNVAIRRTKIPQKELEKMLDPRGMV